MKPNRRTARAARELFRLCTVNGALDAARVRVVAARLASSGRRGALPMLGGFRRLIRLEQERRTAVVESAAALPSDVRETVRERLAATYGGVLNTTFAVNPALVGGMRIKVGSDVYDGSVRARLAALQGRL
jgi:F-type H+-transporting ATPase subunit delta